MLTDVMKDYIVSAILSAGDFSLMVTVCGYNVSLPSPKKPLQSHIHRRGEGA